MFPPKGRGKRKTDHPIKNFTDILLDRFSLAASKATEAQQDAILKYQWNYYNDLAYQRNLVSGEISKSLLEVVEGPIEFNGWQRVLRHKYTLHPLSVQGSMLDPSGGRFNYGAIDHTHFTPFPGLYIAIDKKTALQEALAQSNHAGGGMDHALAATASISCISLQGRIGSYIDLRNPKLLQGFVDIIKQFKLSKSIIEDAQSIGLPAPSVVTDVQTLMEALLEPKWRAWPMHTDVPHPSQIFGQIVQQIGIEGIIYPSKFTNKICIVVFGQNFEDKNDSYIHLDDDFPTEVGISRMDASTWGALIA